MATADMAADSRAHSFATTPPVPSAGGALSAASWGAVLAGAAVAAAASLVLLALGTGLGLASISPWAHKGVQVGTFGVASIAWVLVTQLCASALGGYLAGRLRTRWLSVHTDEVYFRDTAHGLLTWAVATLVTAGLLVSVVSNATGTAAQATATVAAGAAVGAGTAAGAAAGMAAGPNAVNQNLPAGAGPLGYLVDSLFRKDATAAVTSSTLPAPMPGADGAAANARLPVPEVTRIFVNSIGVATLPQQDTRYLGQLVAQHTGMPQADAERRVTDAFSTLQASIANAKTAAEQAAERARKAAIQVSLWLFISLLAGAFIACYTATLGGRERDA